MEIEINSKKSNAILDRTEVYFTVNHAGEKTPNREIIKTELADMLNAKNNCVIVDSIHSETGLQKSRGYAKIYSSVKKVKNIERKHMLKRNNFDSVKPEKKSDEEKQDIKGKKTIESEQTDKGKTEEKEE